MSSVVLKPRKDTEPPGDENNVYPHYNKSSQLKGHSNMEVSFTEKRKRFEHATNSFMQAENNQPGQSMYQ